ncbi:hypothetical protein H5410_021614 [Solanum commersonii]|uniref:Ribulose bisphosphate carboxylase large subunit C-terminal domain-containing protein n=1 Tax=Solanum commersonii TaxID=4109 RepID=A0A9J5ZD26_SOLCO|nr:hypothetical protein H5410_021614 [Solanum commersonii]
MHDYLTRGFTANTTLAHYCRDNGLLLHIHREMHAVIDRQKNHGIHFRVLAKVLRMSGGDHIHSGTVVGKLEGERDIILGFVNLLRNDFIEQDRSRGIISLKIGSLYCVFYPWLRDILGVMHRAVANRVALEACGKARNEGRILLEGNEIIRGFQMEPELAAACELVIGMETVIPSILILKIRFLRGEDPYYNSYMSYMYDTQYSWNNHINSCIDNYLQSQICIDTSIISGNESYGDSYIYRAICSGESLNSSENEGSRD